jgi:hypothetical protein
VAVAIVVDLEEPEYVEEAEAANEELLEGGPVAASYCTCGPDWCLFSTTELWRSSAAL